MVIPVLLSLIGIVFGCMPFVLGFRRLPRWIRFGLHSAGAAFLIAAVLISALHALGSRISPELHRFLFAHVLLICGMAFGILFLLAASGEYFKALRELDTTRHKTLSHSREERSQDGV